MLIKTILKGRDHMPLPQKQVYTSEDYWNLPDGQRAELIDGKLYAMAPPNRIHQKLVMELASVIHNHIKNKSGSCEVYPAPFAVNLNADDSTWVEPDISVICNKSKLSDRGCDGAPDWIIEIISPSTQSLDYLKKLWLYQKAGVREYWIVNPITHVVNVFDFEYDEKNIQYSFDNTIPVCIYEDLSICISDLI